MGWERAADGLPRLCDHERSSGVGNILYSRRDVERWVSAPQISVMQVSVLRVSDLCIWFDTFSFSCRLGRRLVPTQQERGAIKDSESTAN